MVRLGLVLGMLLSTGAHAADADAGRSIYVAKCLACHGQQGKGDGPAAAALPKKPADMSTSEFWRGRTDEQLQNTITNGKPGGAMRAFPMKPEQMGNLVAYLRTFEP